MATVPGPADVYKRILTHKGCWEQMTRLEPAMPRAFLPGPKAKNEVRNILADAQRGKLETQPGKTMCRSGGFPHGLDCLERF